MSSFGFLNTILHLQKEPEGFGLRLRQMALLLAADVDLT